MIAEPARELPGWMAESAGAVMVAMNMIGLLASRGPSASHSVEKLRSHMSSAPLATKSDSGGELRGLAAPS